MKSIGIVTAAGILALAAAATFPTRTQSASLPANGGVYTAAQAKAGAQLYAEKCSACHGATLRGEAGPALAGNAFTAQWTGEPASDPYAMMVANMPLAEPGSLKPSEYLAIMAFILQRNAFPAGATPLTSEKLRSVILTGGPR
jgi:mono/diheme cytochrome c family protein